MLDSAGMEQNRRRFDRTVLKCPRFKTLTVSGRQSTGTAGSNLPNGNGTDLAKSRSSVLLRVSIRTQLIQELNPMSEKVNTRKGRFMSLIN
jgi:hypothetical protein